MIEIENVDVYGWQAAIRGMRNSWDSWEDSDSRFHICAMPGLSLIHISEPTRH